MEVFDFFLTPLFLGIFYALAYWVRPFVTNQFTKPYFIRALTLKFVGCVALGFIYQFYYSGGDTFNYFYHTKLIHSAFDHSFATGWKLLLDNGGSKDPALLPYVAGMYWHEANSPEFLVSRIAAFFGLFCFNSYVVISLFFTVISFSGVWAMYIAFAKIRPQVYKQLAWTLFYTPSLFFWGSGLLKDSLCIGALGWLFYALYRGAIQRQMLLKCSVIGVIAAYALISIKVYILLCFMPAALLWAFNETNSQIKNKTVRLLAKPLFIAVGVAVGFYAVLNITKGDAKYDVNKIGERSKITADYIYQQSVLQEGSAYHLGELDGTIGSMVKLAPMAIVTSLFRPFPWEARNPVMVLSAIEAFFFLIFTLRIFYRVGVFKTLSVISKTPILSLCFIFSLIFAASVGVSTSNFGTLVRYKIPLIPFYLSALYILDNITSTSVKTGTKARKPLQAA